MESDKPFSQSRTDEEAKAYIISYIERHNNVVITSTRGDLGDEITSLYDCVIYLSAPAELRIARIRSRALEKFGSRVLPGGDMYEQEERFFAMASSRSAEKTEIWLDTLLCRVIKVSGTDSIHDNIEKITSILSVVNQ